MFAITVMLRIITPKNPMNRRNALSLMAAGSAAGILSSSIGSNDAIAQRYEAATPRKSKIKITKVRIIHTYPNETGFGIVKVETSEPGLYGLGCATGIRRYKTLTAAVEEYLDPLLRGKDPSNIEDIWQTVNVSTYWRNGPILNTVIAGLDQALWDIKAKQAGLRVVWWKMPVCGRLLWACQWQRFRGTKRQHRAVSGARI